MILQLNKSGCDLHWLYMGVFEHFWVDFMENSPRSIDEALNFSLQSVQLSDGNEIKNDNFNRDIFAGQFVQPAALRGAGVCQTAADES